MTRRILDGSSALPTRAGFARFTLVLFFVPVMSGWFQYTLGPTVDVLRMEQGVSRQVASLLGTVSSLGGIIGAVVVVRLRVIVWGAVGCAAGIGFLTLGNGMGFALSGVLVFGIARVLSMNSMISGISLRHGTQTGPVLTSAYALTSATGILAPLALSISLRCASAGVPAFTSSGQSSPSWWWACGVSRDPRSSTGSHPASPSLRFAGP
jgi:hypothetical protein